MHPTAPATAAPPAIERDDGFDDLFRRLLPQVRATCTRILGDAQAGEDAAAEAFVRALVRWRRLQGHPNPEAWIVRVATNVALDVVRARRRRGTSTAQGLDDVAGPADASVLDIDTARALAALPRRQREAVVLRHVVGLGERETADAMGVSPNTAKTHCARGLAALRADRNLDLEGGLA